MVGLCGDLFPLPRAPCPASNMCIKSLVTTCSVRVPVRPGRRVRLFAHRTEPKRGEGQGAGGPAHAMVGPCGDLFPLPRAPCPASNICIKSSGYDMFGCSARVPVAPVGAPIRASNRAKAGRGSGGRGQGSGPHHGRAMRRSVPPAPRPLPRFKYMHQIISYDMFGESGFSRDLLLPAQDRSPTESASTGPRCASFAAHNSQPRPHNPNPKPAPPTAASSAPRSPRRCHPGSAGTCARQTGRGCARWSGCSASSRARWD
jgi:hypothetical protein